MMKAYALGICSAFIAFATPNTTSAQVCGPDSTCVSGAPQNCKVDGEKIFRVNGCRASVTAGWDGTSNPTERGSCIANPPRGYILIDHDTIVVSDNNGSFNVSKYVSGLDYHYDQEIDDAYKNALALAGKIVDNQKRKEAEAKINSEWEQHKHLVENVKVNADTVRVEVSARGHGSAIDRKRGWIDTVTILHVKCAAPTDLKEQLVNKYNLVSLKGGSAKSVVFSNDKSVPIYLTTKFVDKYTKCTDGASAVSVSTIKPGREAEFLADPELSACYLASEALYNGAELTDNCRANIGDTIFSSKMATECVR